MHWVLSGLYRPHRRVKFFETEPDCSLNSSGDVVFYIHVPVGPVSEQSFDDHLSNRNEEPRKYLSVDLAKVTEIGKIEYVAPHGDWQRDLPRLRALHLLSFFLPSRVVWVVDRFHKSLLDGMNCVFVEG